MSVPYRTQVLYRGTALRVVDVRCRPAEGSPGPEETASDYDLVFPRSGFFVQHLGSRTVAGDPNHVLFFHPDQPYRVSHPLPGGDECTVLSLSKRLLVDILASVAPHAADRPGRLLAVTHVPTSAEVDLLHRLILHGLRRGNLAGLAVEEICLRLAAHVMASAHGVSRRHAGPRREMTDRRHARLADEARQALAARFRERLGLEELVVATGCSPYHLCRVFRREVGMTIHRYRSRLRLRAALEAVAGGARDLTGLALDLGFSDHSHFTNSFRREFGLPPSALRREETLRELLTLSKNLQA